MKLEPAPALKGGVDLSHAGARSGLAEELGAVLCSLTSGDAAIADRLAEAVACELPRRHGLTTVAPPRRALWLTPRSWIVLCPRDEAGHLVRSIAEAFPGREAHGAPYSDAMCWLQLSGDLAEDMLRQGCFLSLGSDGLEPGFAKRTVLAGVPAILLRESTFAWLIGVERSRVHYLASWLANLNIVTGDRQ